MIHAMVLGLKDDMKAGMMDVVYTAYTIGQYEYESDCPAEETVVKETVNKIVLIETYPFLWTILVLFWTYVTEDVTDWDHKAGYTSLYLGRCMSSWSWC
jgi:hypothetical protein